MLQRKLSETLFEVVMKIYVFQLSNNVFFSENLNKLHSISFVGLKCMSLQQQRKYRNILRTSFWPEPFGIFYEPSKLHNIWLCLPNN